jgi:hypothetical protein
MNNLKLHAVFMKLAVMLSAVMTSVPCLSQQKIPQSGIIGLADSLAAKDSVNSIMVKNISELRARPYHTSRSKKKSGNDKIFVTVSGYSNYNDGGGGSFIWIDSSGKADNGGSIINPAGHSGAGRWERQFGRMVNVLWFGAKADNGATDNLPFFKAAIAAANTVRYDTVHYAINKERGQLYIPGNNGYYYLSDSLLISSNIEIVGDYGIFPYYPSRLMFATNKSGIIISFNAVSGDGASWGCIRNLELKSESYSNDTTRHGIKTNTRVIIDNVYVQLFGGNGLEIRTAPDGNCNNSYISNLHARFCGMNGIFLIGQESNNCTFISPDVQNNSRCGIDDKSFLGNNYLGIHSAYNGIRPGNMDVACQVDGKKYIAIENSRNIKPTVTPGWENYWFGPLLGYLEYANNWDPAKFYHYSSCFRSKGTVQHTAVFGSYTESGQGPVILGAACMWIGGDVGSGVANPGMGHLDIDQYDWLFKGNSLRVDSIDRASGSPYNSFTALDRTKGLVLGLPGEELAMKAFKSDELMKVYSAGLPNLSNFQFTMAGFDVSKLGWSEGKAYGLGIASPRLGFRMLNNTPKIRTMGMCDGAPFGGGPFGSGEIYLNAGTDNAVIYWKRNAANTAFDTIRANIYTERSNASASVVTPTGDWRENFFDVTGLATGLTINPPSGTSANHNTLLIRIKDDGKSRTLTWNSVYRAGTDLALPARTTAGKEIYLKFIRNGAASKWDLISKLDGF